MADPLEHLNAMRAHLESIYEHVPRFVLSADNLPIIDILQAGSNSESDNSSPNEDRDDANGSDGHVQTKDRSPLRHRYTTGGGIPGLRLFRENVRNDIEQIDKYLARHEMHRTTVIPSAFATNAPYLIAIWNELVRARQPIAFVDKSFPVPAENTPLAVSSTFSRNGAISVKVDVGADNGRHWIRVNTIKNSRLLVEFRELDSYLTESDSGGEEDERPNSARNHNGTRRDELDNSLLQMGKQLLSAARAPRAASGETPTPPAKITLRLTRLVLDAPSLVNLEAVGLTVVGPRHLVITSDSSLTDPRIAQALHTLLTMGLDVILGEHEFAIPPELSKPLQKRLVPSRQINLDLSVLIALISDITHASLPSSAEEAHTRYIPTPAERARSRKRRQQQKELIAHAKAQTQTHKLVKPKPRKPTSEDTTNTNAENSESDDEGESVHSRALANQVLREMDLSLLSEIAARLEQSPAEFWTTREVRDRCLRIVDKIGGPGEKRRASALFFDPDAPDESVLGIRYASVEEAREAYWSESRHPREMIPGLVPVRVFKDENEKIVLAAVDGTTTEATINPFWTSLNHACARLLSSGASSHPRTLPSHNASISKEKESNEQEEGESEIERAAVTSSNARLTLHTVDTLARGAARRWTTLTANRASVREMVKESAKDSNSDSATKLEEEEGLGGRMTSLSLASLGNEKKASGTDVAAIWVVEPRSLAESMRGDFASS